MSHTYVTIKDLKTNITKACDPYDDGFYAEKDKQFTICLKIMVNRLVLDNFC